MKLTWKRGDYGNWFVTWGSLIEAQKSGRGYWCDIRIGWLNVWRDPLNGELIYWFVRRPGDDALAKQLEDLYPTSTTRNAPKLPPSDQ